ncbi:ATP-binding cassette subfamily B protein [Mobilisporobacter senegalensis]|uniref:ATP-binding cassette subfamily B protein n=1 Tax=Mobilisporobacter senegalensis TaxID=1329262 RepID=A0A3N1XKZ4_9FIRM|nr:ABC transporter ATP-binding protein [Mobilisporobacter senegalensis]ROR25722.1 ATP-binding cassette subfamily B protein [Mobilisporobacter senegalensis]
MFKKVLEYAGEYRRTTYKAVVLMLIGLIFSVSPFFLAYQIIRPLLLKQSIDILTVSALVAAIAVCGVLHTVFYIKGLELSHISAFHTLKNLRISLQGKLEKQPLGAIQDKGTGAIKKMFVDDIETIELLLAHTLPEGLANLAVPVIVFIGMFIADWKLGLLSLCALPLGVLCMGMMFKIGMRDMGSYYAAGKKMNNTIVEYINGMEVVKVFNRDGESYHRFEGDVKSYRDFTLKWYKACWPFMALYSSILPCIAMFTLPIGAYLVLNNHSTLPDFVLVLCMSFSVGPLFLKALGFMSTLPQINFKIKSLEDTFNSPPLQQSDKPFTGNDHGVEFENVSFAYKEEEVLHGISLKVKEGDLVALVGESGSGKSTLAKLLVHFYDVTGGCVKIGGQDIRDMSVEALNNEISYVAQEQFLFNISLLENIRLGKLDATDDEVMAAAQKAQCGEFLARLQDGIHTMAGDGGKQLSGGERQRISLARAILKNAPIIVLDEATAFMDPENEEKMNEAIAELIHDKTVIVIAHRLYSIVGADIICVLERGNLVAAGTHKELLEGCPAYQKLWSAAEDSASWKVGTAIGGEQA